MMHSRLTFHAEMHKESKLIWTHLNLIVMCLLGVVYSNLWYMCF